MRVHAIEAAAAAILGEPFPFSRPKLPSDQRGKRKASVRAAGGVKTKLKLRKLDADETAYRVTYSLGGDGAETRVAEYDDADALTTLLGAQSGKIQVQAVVTIDAAGTVKAWLQGAAPADI